MAKNNEAYVAAENKMQTQEKELSELIQYPPFSEIDDGRDTLDYDGINPNWGFPGLSQRGVDLREAMIDAISKMSLEKGDANFYDVDPSIIAGCFKDVLKEFADDIDEARLMQKRYPDSPLAALKSYKIK